MLEKETCELFGLAGKHVSVAAVDLCLVSLFSEVSFVDCVPS